jgi:hypothetical protein
MKSTAPRASIASAVFLVVLAILVGGRFAIGAEYGARPEAQADLNQDSRWWSPGDGRLFPPFVEYRNEFGSVRTLNVGGPTETKGHPFFTPLGNNGRACVTCHQPADGMSLSAATAKVRWARTQGKDPLFAAIDGSNCPHLPQEKESSHSLLLERGLIRVFRPWPPMDLEGRAIDPQFTIEVVRDPTGCNTHPEYGLKSKTPMVSVFRRPRPVTNTKYLTAVGFSFEPKNGLPLPRDPETGAPVSGNLMADSRAMTLKAQAIDAALVHLQMPRRPSDVVLEQIVSFERQLYTAQNMDRFGGALDGGGVSGGPETLQRSLEGDLQYGGSPIWKEFLPWAKSSTTTAGLSAQDASAQKAFRESVARGAETFAKRTFLIWDAAGITNMGFGNPVRNSCAFCHNMQRTGMDVAPGQVDLGTTNEPSANASPELPLFKLTCKEKNPPHPHYGRVIYTQDPGYALTTGKCIDIGKITIQQMRGLAARAPYFSNGSARTLREIVEFYDRRYRIGYTEQEKQDLANLMSVL